MDWLVKSFHPTCHDVHWLQQRFDAFYQAKLQTDFEWAQMRLKHAPVHAKVVHKLFGRHDPVSDLLLHHGEDKNLFESYVYDMFGERGIEKRMLETVKDRIALTCALTGPIRDAKRVMSSLLTSGTELKVDTLMLFELVHMTVFCKEEYMSNVKPCYQWVINYICHLVQKVSLNETSLPFAIDSNGLETDTLLKQVRSLMLSCYPNQQVQQVIHVRDEDDHHPYNTLWHRATLNEMKGRLICQKTYHKDL